MRQVTNIEEELERMISRGELPETGTLPSEQMLARRYGVARGTIREALMRLATRGLIVRHQGRQARAVAFEHVVTLENLGVALHDLERAPPQRWRLLEGYFELKRETTLELLARCCAHAPPRELERLANACFALRDGARWDDGARHWVEQEFELLRLAAHAADRPGHFLLVQSLERAFRGMAGVVRPLLASDAVRHWAESALPWLTERDVEALRRDLPPLLLACDEHVLGSLESASAVTHGR
ncbi:GntR family transcriptional regulator [Archangium sp.]|uniref:GntR family transcriptional regulator n=1 Tax=Archangium sp. TaxID=1872627 RepID=UPI002ED7FB96